MNTKHRSLVTLDAKKFSRLFLKVVSSRKKSRENFWRSPRLAKNLGAKGALTILSQREKVVALQALFLEVMALQALFLEVIVLEALFLEFFIKTSRKSNQGNTFPRWTLCILNFDATKVTHFQGELCVFWKKTSITSRNISLMRFLSKFLALWAVWAPWRREFSKKAL